MTLILSGTDGLSDVDGTAATPAIRGTDTNTGIFFPAADTIAFSEGGAEVGRFSSAGNFGLGTVSPTSSYIARYIDIASATSAGVVFSGPRKFSAYSSSGSTFVIIDDDAAGATRLAITSTGDLQFNSGYGSAATAYGCRAWVNFNGTGTVAIRASGNVSSITDNNTGDYTVNFTTAMTDTNYAVTGTCFSTATGTSRGFISHSSNVAYSPATGSMRFCSIAAGVGNTDYQYEYISIFR